MNHISIRWFDPEETILLIEFQDKWTWDEVIEMTHQGHAMTRTKAHIVETVLDLNYTTLPDHIGLLTRMRTLTGSNPPNTGGVYVVNIAPFSMRIIETFLKIAPRMRKTISVGASVGQVIRSIMQQREVPVKLLSDA